MNRNLGVCPNCHSACPHEEMKCWMCGATLREMTSYSGLTYSLTSAFLVTTLICVCCGLVVIAPGLAVVVGLLSAPALIRTVLLVERRKHRGFRLNPEEKVFTFFGYVGVALLAAFGGAIAFVGSCFAACAGLAVLESSGAKFSGDWFIWISTLVAAAVGLVVFITLNVVAGAKD